MSNHRGEPDILKEHQYVATDHEYWGNLCSGFGGKVECEQMIWTGGAYLRQCRLEPWNHYKPKHRLDPMVGKFEV